VCFLCLRQITLSCLCRREIALSFMDSQQGPVCCLCLREIALTFNDNDIISVFNVFNDF
jgi:hypothetical protein